MEASLMASSSRRSRQRNCSNCIHAKRRCDRRTPTCSRCIERKILCVYRESQKSIGADTQGGEQSTNTNYLGMMSTNYPIGYITDSTNINFGMYTTMDNHPSMDLFMDPTEDNRTSTHHQWLTQTELESVIQRPSSPAGEEATRAYKEMQGFCHNMEPWHLYDTATPLNYAMTRVKDFIADIAAHNAAPFMHRHLYRAHTPQCIVSCFAISVLYMNRTPENVPMVMRALHKSVKELLETEADSTATTPILKLACTQALFIYQIIRLLDGDIALRAQGERDILLLYTWLSDLCRIRENLGDLAQLEENKLRTYAPVEWESWTLAESLRRTVLIAYSFIALYEIMKDPDKTDDYDVWSRAHRWTLSRHLWEADSSSKFARMWKEKPQFIITNYSFSRFLQNGSGEDVDEFAEILLSVYQGVDEAKEFIGPK